MAYERKKEQKIETFIRIANVLQTTYCGKTYDELMEELELPRRTIERLLDDIKDYFGEDALITVENSSNNKKHWRLVSEDAKRLIHLSKEELSLLTSYVKKSKNKNLENITAKIEKLNKDKINKNDVSYIMAAQGFAVKQQFNEKISPELIGKIYDCVLADKKLNCQYEDEPQELEPYGIIYGDKTYLVAASQRSKGKPWKFLLSKIKNTSISKEYFDRIEDFDLKAFCEKSFGIYSDNNPLNVELLFNKDVADDVQNYYFHPTQKIAHQNDDSVKVSFTACGSFEIITELLKWRDTVKILAPQSLKDEYKKEVQKMYKNLED